MRSFGPSVFHEQGGTFRPSCHSCTFLVRYGKDMCRYVNPMRAIPDPNNTPEWCQMRDLMIRDARDIAAGIEHKVFRWSGRKTDDPRIVFCGIPSDAARQFRLAAREVRRGMVRLVDEHGQELARHPVTPTTGGRADG